MMEMIFFLFVFLSGYSYFLYPLIMMILPVRSARVLPSWNNAEIPNISLIITAHNEQMRIEDKIENTLNIEYPLDHLEIIVASDCSIDNTNKIVESYHEKGVRLISVNERKGKENAQLKGISAAHGEILVFSDVATILPKDALRNLASYFADPRIGAVSSEDRILNDFGKVEGEGAYVRYEMWVRKLESKVYSLVGLSGSFFACRQEVANHWDITIPSDFNTAINCVRQGKIAVSAPDVIGYYKSISDSSMEYKRKYRTALRGMNALKSRFDILNPFINPLFAFEIISHKLMRWLTPWFVITLLASNIYLIDTGLFYVSTMAGFCAFFVLALLGLISRNLRKYTIFAIPFFFVQVNLALMHAGFDAVRGKKMTVWKPSTR